MIYYRLGSNSFFRKYSEIGYIINKCNFKNYVTDMSGSVFLSALSHSPQTFDDIIENIQKQFIDADVDEIKNDAIEFFTMLEQDGFMVSGENEEELNKKDILFSYKNLPGNDYKISNNPIILRSENESQSYLPEYFKTNPSLMLFQIELTSKCNEHCIHCYIPHENRINDIEPEFYYSVIEQCYNMGVLELALSGGEPMLHPNFCEFVKKAKEYYFSLTILSNLTLLNDQIISVLKEQPLSNLQVSLYSMNPNIHDSITRIPGSFEKTKDAILELIKNDIPLQISCPTLKQNKNCYKDVLKWAHEHKCRAITDFVLIGRYDGSVDNLSNRLSIEDTEIVIKNIIENDIAYQQRIIDPGFEEYLYKKTDEELICGVCTTTLCMIANGNVYPCPGWQNYSVGNMKETSLSDIWNNSPKVKYLRNLRKKDLPKCAKCEDRLFCSVCMVRNANESPSRNPLEINEHFCKIAAVNREVVMNHRRESASGIL